VPTRHAESVRHVLRFECTGYFITGPYLEGPGLLVWVVGQPRPIELTQRRFRALHPAGLQITFALLCRPNLIQTNYREIARAANVALGSVGPAVKDLEAVKK